MAGVDAKVCAEGYPQADAVTRGGVLLACHHGLNDAQIDYIHETFLDFVERMRTRSARPQRVVA
jgi:CDP-6-deoxy-D-xylo-4-hexulose-3-dehydrase